MKRSFFEPDGRSLNGDDLFWLYNQDKIVIVDYSNKNAIAEKSLSDNTIIAKLLSHRSSYYLDFLVGSAELSSHFAMIEHDGSPDMLEPFWKNGWFPPLDGISLTYILKNKNPRRYIEVGSGNSTKFAAAAISAFGLRTEIISIDPHPRAEIDNLCKDIIRMPLEDVDVAAALGNITEEDVFFLIAAIARTEIRTLQFSLQTYYQL